MLYFWKTGHMALAKMLFILGGGIIARGEVRRGV